MSSVSRSVSFHGLPRPNMKAIVDHQFLYGPDELNCIHGDLPTLAQSGGVQGIAHALRCSLKTGLQKDEFEPKQEQGKQATEAKQTKSKSTADPQAAAFIPFERRKELYGENVYPPKELTSFIEFCKNALGDPLLIVLVFAGCLSIGLGMISHPDSGWYEGLAILFAVLLVVFISAWNNWNQQRQFQELEERVRDEAASNVYTVIRGGKTMQVRPELVQAGELVSLSPGSFIPADGILVGSENSGNAQILVNESRMTGESVDIAKGPNEPFLLAGTEIRQGECLMLVTAVGMRSAYGKIMSSLRKEREMTPLQHRLEHLAGLIGKIGLFSAVLLFVTLIIRWIVSVSSGWTSSSGSELVEVFVTCITLLVVAIPEGLPLAVTVSLAYSMRRMYDDNIMINELEACETMGSVTAICSDKTGTLTQNKMKVRRMWSGAQTFHDSLPNQGKSESEFAVLRDLLVQSVVVNSKSWIDEAERKKEAEPDEPEAWTCWKDGNQTEISILAFCLRMGLDLERERSVFPVMKSFPFDSANKQSSVILPDWAINRYSGRLRCGFGDSQAASKPEAESQIPGSTSGKTSSASSPASISPSELESLNSSIQVYRRYFKGAAENILQRCNRWIDSTGQIRSLNELMDDGKTQKIAVSEYIVGMACNGLRTIASSYIDYSAQEMKYDEDGKVQEPLDNSKDNEGILVAVFGIQDPLRPDSASSVADMIGAGICVRMVTGDALETAKSIAEECGIYTPKTNPEHCAMLGVDLRELFLNQRDAELRRIIPNLRVVARSSPTDKELLVKWLREVGNEIVAVTGDGSNDAQALATAHVGVAMFSGTEVAKAAAKIWILDNKFASVATSVVWGREVYANIRKFVQFQLSVNICAICLVVSSAFGGIDTPITPVQLLWVNLIMDTFAALALGTEVPTPQERRELLSRKPEPSDASIISPMMWKHILGQAMMQFILLSILLWSDTIFTYNSDIVNWNRDSRYCAVFNAFVFLQLWNEFNARRIYDQINCFENLTSNWIYGAIKIGTVGVQALIVEFGGGFSNTTHLNWREWLICIGLGFLSIPTGLALRLAPTPDIAGGFQRFLVTRLPWLYNILCVVQEDDEEGEKDSDSKADPTELKPIRIEVVS